ncbi:MAG: SDR family NAD(P)-dependent oxidoreductase [Pseudomonadales bacterium]
MRLEGKTALVTAAGRGIGKAIAIALAEAGADVIVNSFSEATTEATAGEVRARGRRALAVAGDATDAACIVDLVARGNDHFGRIDILVNNVGAAPRTAISQGDGPLAPAAALWDALYAQNLRSIVLMCEAVVPQMVERRSGKIINISSIAGKTSLSARLLSTLVHPSYGAMKAAVVSYTHTLAEQLGEHGINVNAVCPGIVYTDAWAGNAERAVKMFPEFRGMDPKTWFEGIARGDYPEIFDRTPLRRPQTVEDVAKATVFLASDDADNITGQSLMVDGGMVKT